MGSNMTGDDQRILERSVDLPTSSSSSSSSRTPSVALSDSALTLTFELDRTVNIIADKGFMKIALQFPDELLHAAVRICELLTQRTQKTVFILADTTFGSTDVDEIAAEHGDADFIVHYGRATLNPNARIPVQYVFGRGDIDGDDAFEKFAQFFGETVDQKVLVLYDVVYHHAMAELGQRIKDKGFTGTVLSTVVTEWLKDLAPGVDGAKQAGLTSAESPLKGRQFSLRENQKIEDYKVFYVGGESTTLSSIMMRLNKCQFFTYDPATKTGKQETANMNKTLMKRYYLVQKAKDAEVIGIVVGTLGMAGYLEVVDNLKRLVKAAGKKSFTFVMGKLNVAKMANFLEIDIFVLVASPENSLIDSKEFFKPVITPFELEMALTKGKEWTGDYVIDFQELLDGLGKSVELQESLDPEDEDAEPYFSVIKGKIITPKQVTSRANPVPGVQDLTLRNQNNQLALGNTAAGDFLSSRLYQGLEQRLGETPVSLAVEGRRGIARGYHNPGESDDGGLV